MKTQGQQPAHPPVYGADLPEGSIVITEDRIIILPSEVYFRAHCQGRDEDNDYEGSSVYLNNRLKVIEFYDFLEWHGFAKYFGEISQQWFKARKEANNG